MEPGRRLSLPSEWGDSASINPMTPIDSCMWQPRRSRTPPTAWSAVAAGVRDRHLAARSVASLARLASCCGDDGNFDPSLTVPDGVVPSALPLFLYSIGVPEDMMVETVGRILRAQCESYACAELTRARQVAGLITQLGIHAPGTTGHVTTATKCSVCDSMVSRLVHVRASTCVEADALTRETPSSSQWQQRYVAASRTKASPHACLVRSLPWRVYIALAPADRPTTDGRRGSRPSRRRRDG